MGLILNWLFGQFKNGNEAPSGMQGKEKSFMKAAVDNCPFNDLGSLFILDIMGLEN